MWDTSLCVAFQKKVVEINSFLSLKAAISRQTC